MRQNTDKIFENLVDMAWLVQYLPGQLSLDTVSAKLFKRRKGKDIFSRRAVSADRYTI